MTADDPNTTDYPADPLQNAASGNNWYAGNYHNGGGKYDVKEAFIEANVPLFDGALGKANFNPAFRATRYSTSGYVSTWKLGGVWDTPIDGVRLRVVESRDVRAPNLSELFAAPVIMNNTVTDRNTGFGVQILNTAIGNANLKPERSNNLEAGIVFRPSWLRGFSASLDYFNIRVKGAIQALTNQQIVDLCYNGNTAFCPNVYLGGTPGTANPSYVIVQPFNLARITARGFDIEASYQFNLQQLKIPGNFTIRALATHNISFVTDAGVPGQAVLQGAGQNAGTGTTPYWKSFTVESYSVGPASLTLTQRFVSAGKINPIYITCQALNCPLPTIQNPTTNFNHVDGALYLDVGGAYNVTHQLQAYFKVDNVLNHTPPPGGSMQIYDTIGRTFRIGLRLGG